jgi:lipopolysaccharide export system permease protein
MLFKQALRRDLFNLSGAVFAVLFIVMVTTSLIRLLGRAATDRVDSADVLPLIAFAAINTIPTLMGLTLFVTVLLVVSRAFRDSEMVVWSASGLSLSAWIRPVVEFALPFVLLIAVVSLLVGPWANRQADELRQRFERREDVSMVSAGQFRESARADRVFFVESLNEERTEVRNVFVSQTQGDALTVVASSGGRIITEPDGTRFLILEDGRRWEGTWGTPQYRLMVFERYGIRLEPAVPVSDVTAAKALDTWTLLARPSEVHFGELARRVAAPLAALIVAVAAIPLAFVNPRAGQSVNLIVALLFYLIYNNAGSVMQAWIAQGKVSFLVGVLAPHGVVLALVLWLFWRRITLRRSWVAVVRGWFRPRLAA